MSVTVVAPPAAAAPARVAIWRVLRLLAVAAVAAAIFVFAWLYRFNDPGGSFAFLTDDHFFYLVRAWQILFGDLPVRDFVDHGAPLYYYVGAAVQKWFGRGTLSEITFSVTVLSACAAGVFLLSWRASRSALLALAATLLLHVLLEPRFYNYPKILVYLAAIPALWAFIDSPGNRRIALLAVVTVVGFLFRHDHGVFVAASFAALLLLMPRLSWTQRRRHAIAYGLLVVLLLAPYLVFIQRHGGVVLYFRTAVAWSERDRARAKVVWPGLFDHPDGVSRLASHGRPTERVVASIRDNSIAWLFYGELALPLLAFAVLARRRWRGADDVWPNGWENGWEKIAVVAVLGLLLDAGFLRSPLEARLADPSVPLVVLAAWLPGAVIALVRGEMETRSPRPWLGTATTALTAAATIAILAIMTIAATGGVRGRLQKTSLADGLDAALDRASTMRDEIRSSFPLSREAASRDGLLTLAMYVRECTAPTDRVFMEQYLPQVIALSERGFAGGQADLRPGFFTSTAMQRLTVSRLERQSVPIALLAPGHDLGGFRESFPIVVAYFDQHYRSAGERTFDRRYPIQLLVRSDLRPVRRFQPLGWPCYR